MTLRSRRSASPMTALLACLIASCKSVDCFETAVHGVEPAVQLSSVDQNTQLAIFATAEQAVAPKQALSTFEVLDGFELELAASEPDVVDPVAMRFDSRGRMWIVEMRDYPNGPTSSSEPAKGRVVVLEDMNKDGQFEQRSVFADHLLFPTGLQPTENGAYVTLAGKLVLMEDIDSDLVADRTTDLIMDFAQKNPQLRANDPTLLADGWLYVCNGLTNRDITSTHGSRSTFSIGSRDLRINLQTNELEAIVGPSQFGMSWDRASTRYFCSNRNPCVQVVLDSDQLTAKTVLRGLPITSDALPSGNDSKVFPISRTWTTSNLHANQFTAACGLLIADLVTASQTGTDRCTLAIVCEPTGSLVHASKLNISGIISKSESLSPNKELLSSRDPWFRPVNLTIGPDGALYIIDMYRAVIEHPEWVPEELKKRPDTELGNDRGRIYRLKCKNSGSSLNSFVEAAWDKQLVDLSSGTSSIHDFEERFQSQSAQDVATAWKVARRRYPGRSEWIGKIREGLGSKDAKQVFEIAWYTNTLSNDFIQQNSDLQSEIVKAIKAWHDEPHILAALYPLVDNKAVFLRHVISGLQFRPDAPSSNHEWYKNLILEVANSSSGHQVLDWLEEQISASATDSNLESHHLLMLNVINGVYRSSIRNRATGSTTISSYVSNHFSQILEKPQSSSALLQSQLGRAIGFLPDSLSVQRTRQLLRDSKVPVARISLLQSIAEGASVDANDLIACFLAASGDVRREAFFAVSSQPEALDLLAAKLEASEIPVSHFDTVQMDLLKNGGRVPAIRERFKKILAQSIDSNREQLVQRYVSELGSGGDLQSGRTLFRQHCSACHRMEGHGVQIGPDISDTREQSPLQLITSILDPNRAIDGAYFRYNLLTQDGEIFEGIVKRETSETISIQLANGTLTGVAKSSLESIKSTGTSLMPVGFEAQLTPRQMNDLVYYLKNWRYR